MPVLSVAVSADWCSAHHAYKSLGISQHHFFKLVAAGRVRTMHLPGERLLYRREDIETLRTEIDEARRAASR